MATKSTTKKAKKASTAKTKPATAKSKPQSGGPKPSDAMAKNYQRVFAMKFSKVYPMYILKAESKGRTKKEVDQCICWLTGYTQAELQKQIKNEVDFATFYNQAPAYNPKSSLISGVVCGVRIEDIQDPLMQRLRHLDKLIDELAKGRPMEKILRQ